MKKRIMAWLLVITILGNGGIVRAADSAIDGANNEIEIQTDINGENVDGIVGAEEKIQTQSETENENVTEVIPEEKSDLNNEDAGATESVEGEIQTQSDSGDENVYIYNGHYYKRFTYKVEWETAKKYCEMQGGHLVTIIDENENKMIMDQILSEPNQMELWIGANRGLEDAIDDFKWVSGESVGYANWAQGEPNGSYTCLRIRTNGEWDDGSGDTGFVCEWDSEEQYNSRVDSEDIFWNGHYYRWIEGNLPWESAENNCELKHGHLATITSEEEKKGIDLVIAKSNSFDVSWIGGRRDENNNFQWITKETFEYGNWESGEPNGSSSYAAIAPNKKWDDYSGDVKGFFCEWDNEADYLQRNDNDGVWDGLTVREVQNNDGVYDIYDAKELAWIAQQTNSGNSDFNGCTIRLQADLDLGNIEWWEIGTNNTPFRGSFEGNNHVISNPLYWSGKSEGIFGKVESIQYSSFQNVTVDNCNINAFGWGTGGFGGLIANINGLGGSKTIISNIKINNISKVSTQYGEYAFGGIIGKIVAEQCSVVIENCQSNMEVKSKDGSGGIVGAIVARGANLITIKKCKSSGKISTDGGTAGGIVGKIFYENEVAESTIYLTLNSSSCNVAANSTWTGYGEAIAGGLVGSFNEKKLIMKYCSSSGDVAAKLYQVCVGGLIGKMTGFQNARVENCYASGTLAGTGHGGFMFNYASMGGLIAGLQSSNVVDFKVGNCYFAGSSNRGKGTGGDTWGCILSNTTSGSYEFENCYYLEKSFENSDLLVSTTRDANIKETNCGSRSKDELGSIDTYNNWDFDNVWNIDSSINDGLPYLIIEDDPMDDIEDNNDYDYSSDLDQWIINKGTYNSINYLAKDGNFICSLAVAKSDSDFGDLFSQYLSNMIFRGVEGWKEQFAAASSKEQAEKVIVGLLSEYEDEVSGLAEAETADKCSKILVKTLDQSNWAYAIDFGLNSQEVKELSNLCTEDQVADFFVDGKYDSLSGFLQVRGGYSEDSKVIKCIEQFQQSSQYAEQLSKSMDFIGTGVKILSMTENTAKRVFEVAKLQKADDMYSEMLLYLNEKCVFAPVRDAAGELYGVIHGGYIQELNYVSKELKNELEAKLVDEVLEAAAKKIPFGEIIKTSFDWGTDISNLIFHIEDIQKQKDNMRCVAYVGNCLSGWLLNNLQQYMNASNSQKSYWAKRTVYSYNMLLKTRTAGEKSLQKMMELSRTDWKREYTLSQETLATLESNAEWLKTTGVLNSIITSVIACPVNVEVYDASGNLVLTVQDGTESEGYVNDIYYKVTYQPLSNDYSKIIRFPNTSGYTLKCIATDLGAVDYSVSSISDEGAYNWKEAMEIPVKTGNEIVVSGIAEETPICTLTQDDQVLEYQVQPVTDEFVDVESLQIERRDVQLKEDEKLQITAKITPDNASIKEVGWSSSDEDIATVNSDGVITGVSAGTAVIKGTSSNNKEVFDELSVTVIMKDGIFPVSKQGLYKEYMGKPVELSVVNGKDIKWRGDGQAAIEGYYLDADGVTVTSSTDGSGADADGGAPMNAGDYYVKVNVISDVETDNFTEVIPLHIEKATPVLEDFTFTLPVDSICDGIAKAATVTTKTSIIGMGEISVKYKKADTDVYTSDAPKDAGDYEVYLDAADGGNYSAVNELLIGSFKIIPKQYCVQLTSRIDGSQDDTTIAQLSGGGTFDENSSVIVTAPDKDGYKFLGWYEATKDETGEINGYDPSVQKSTSLKYEFTLESDCALAAVYEANGSVQLSVSGDRYSIEYNGTESAAQDGSFSEALPLGTQITIRVKPENDSFVYWKNGNNKQVSTSTEYTFVLAGETTLVMAKKATEDAAAFVEFVSDYGQVIAGQTYNANTIDKAILPAGPSKVGYTFKSWSLTKEQIKEKINANEKHISVRPVYEALDKSYNLKVYQVYAGSLISENPDTDITMNAGDSKNITASVIDGKKFKCWSADQQGNTILGTQNTYFVQISADMTLYAIYVDADEEIAQVPTIAITNKLAFDDNGVSKISFVSTRSVPEGYTLIEHGMLYGTTKLDEAVFVDGTEGVKKFVSSTIGSAGVFTFNITVGSKKDTVVYDRAYMLVKNNTTGNEEYYYSALESGTYNSLSRN